MYPPSKRKNKTYKDFFEVNLSPVSAYNSCTMKSKFCISEYF